MHSNAKVHLDMTSNRVLSGVKDSVEYYNSWYSSDCFFSCIIFFLWYIAGYIYSTVHLVSNHYTRTNQVDGVIVSTMVVYRRFSSSLRQATDWNYHMLLLCQARNIKETEKTDLFAMRIMCASRKTCLPRSVVSVN